jgi:outer membrane lipoprotein
MHSLLDKLIIAVFAAILLTACSHPISQTSRSSVAEGLLLADINSDPSSFQGQTLILGGAIIANEESAEGSQLELLEWQINRWGEPISPVETGQRYLVKSAKRLDPQRFEAGLLVTLAGSVSGQETRQLNEQDAHYPLFELLEIHVWQSPFRYGTHHHDPAFPHYVGDNSDLPGRHPYDPGYSGYPYSPHSFRIR